MSTVDSAETFDDEIANLVERIRASLRRLPTLSDDAKQLAFARTADLIKSAQSTLVHLKLATRGLDNEAHQAAFQSKCQLHAQVLHDLKTELTTLRCSAVEVSPTQNSDAERNKARATRDHVVNVQAQSIEALMRIEQAVVSAQADGDRASELLVKQGEDLLRTQDKLHRLDGQVDRAKTELNMFIRRMMTDKIILCFILLIIIAVIVVVIVSTRSSSSAPSSSPVPTPPPKQ